MLQGADVAYLVDAVEDSQVLTSKRVSPRFGLRKPWRQRLWSSCHGGRDVEDAGLVVGPSIEDEHPAADGDEVGWRRRTGSDKGAAAAVPIMTRIRKVGLATLLNPRSDHAHCVS